MSWIPCTSRCVYQQDGICTLDSAAARRPPLPGRGLRPLHSCGRRAARIASPIFRTWISRRHSGSGRSPRRRAGMRHWEKPSRRTSEILWLSWLTDRSSPVRSARLCHQVRRHRPVQIAGGQGDYRRQVCGGLVQVQPADDIEVGVTGGDLQSPPLLQHRQQHGCPVVVKTVAGPPGIPCGGGHRQCLDLRQHWPCSLHHTGDAGARRVPPAGRRAASPTGSPPRQGRCPPSRTHRSHWWRRNGSLPPGGCGRRCAGPPRSTARSPPCAPGPWDRRWSPPCSHGR